MDLLTHPWVSVGRGTSFTALVTAFLADANPVVAKMSRRRSVQSAAWGQLAGISTMPVDSPIMRASFEAQTES